MLNDKEAYDIAKIYEQIENELIDDMMKNLSRHRAEETKEGYDWEQWQVLQLQALEEYKAKAYTSFPTKFKGIDKKIEEAITNANQQGGADAEVQILQALKKGLKATRQGSNNFFQINTDRVEAIMDAVKYDFGKAQYALLRQADDQYRKIIFKTQLQASTGSITYEKAVDLATKDFLTHGIQCIQYKNGAMHTISNYAEMAMRTSMKRAYLQGEGTKRDYYGVHTVIVNHRNHACSKCLPFVGKVLIDDVYSGGTSTEAMQKNLPLLSEAIDAGFLHPNCKDGVSTYFEGISDKPKPVTKQEKAYAEAYEDVETTQQVAENKAKAFGRLAKYALDPQDKKMYLAKQAEWQDKANTYTQQAQAVDIGQVVADKIEQHLQGQGDNFTTDEILHILQNQTQLAGAWATDAPAGLEVGEIYWQADSKKWGTFKKDYYPVGDAYVLADSAKGYIYKADNALITDELVVLSKESIGGKSLSKVAVRSTMTAEDYHEMIENLMYKAQKNGDEMLFDLIDWEKEALTKVSQQKQELEAKVQALGGLGKGNPNLAEAQKYNMQKARLSKWEKQWQTSIDAWEKHLNELSDDTDKIIDLHDEIDALQVLKQWQFDFNKEYVGIWKDPVTLKDFADKKDKIQAKIDYFHNEWLHAYTGSGKEAHFYTLKELAKDYKQAGEDLLAFETQITDKEKAIKAIEDKNAELLRIARTGKAPKAKKPADKFKDLYTQERKNQAVWFNNTAGKTEGDAIRYFDNIYRQLLLKERRANSEKFRAFWTYTEGSGKFNRPLSGFEAPMYSGGSGWSKQYFKGVGNVSLNNEGHAWAIKALTELIDEAPALPEDTWVQSGQGIGTLEGFLGGKVNAVKLMNMSEQELQQFVGEKHTIPAFLSTGMTKGGGFSSKDIIMNIYLPKGTKALYVSDLGMFGYGEQEVILQRGGTYAITKIERAYGKIFIDMELRLEEGYDKYWKA